MNPIDTPPDGYPKEDQANYEHTFHEKRKQNWYDSGLKKVMPNGTVIRRYLAFTWVMMVVITIVGIILIDRVNRNSLRSEKAICSITIYAEDQAFRIGQNPKATPGAASGLLKLAGDMRKTGVHCLPPNKH